MRDVQQSQTLDIAEFRRLMGLFATGVCVVSVEGGTRGVAAMTVNSFVSVSLDPMLVAWSVQNRSSQYDLYTQAERFAVSILADNHADTAMRYAARGDSQFASSDFEPSPAGLPVITGALGYLECRRWSLYPAGDHTMIFGEVTGPATHIARDAGGSPLGFFNGKFCSIER